MNFYDFLEKMGARQIERPFLFLSFSIEYASASHLHLCTVFYLVRTWQYCQCVTTICCHSFRYVTVVTVSDTKPMSLKLITLPSDEFAIGGERNGNTKYCLLLWTSLWMRDYATEPRLQKMRRPLNTRC